MRVSSGRGTGLTGMSISSGDKIAAVTQLACTCTHVAQAKGRLVSSTGCSQQGCLQAAAVQLIGPTCCHDCHAAGQTLRMSHW
jgi:hypothetical protein